MVAVMNRGPSEAQLDVRKTPKNVVRKLTEYVSCNAETYASNREKLQTKGYHARPLNNWPKLLGPLGVLGIRFS